MIEFYAFSALAGLGYLLNKRQREAASPPVAFVGERPTVNARDVPSVDNVYHSRHTERVNDSVRKAASKSARAAKNPRKTNVIPRSTFEEGDQREYGIGDGLVKSELTGEVLPVERFTQNDRGDPMLPFFGSRVTQNMNHDTASLSLERLNGAADMFGGKREVPNMFEAQPDVSNVYGAQNATDRFLEHIVPPKSRNNEFPIPREMVGPGIGSYDAAPQGDIMFKERDHIMPKTVDDLRTKSNPKVTYEQPVLDGQKGSKRGMFPKFAKHAPERTVERTSDMNFVTTGARLKPKKRPDRIVLRDTTRPDTHVDYSGSAYAPTGDRKQARPSHEGFRQQLDGPQLNPADAARHGKGAKFDHGKGSILVYGNHRDVTGTRTHKSNVTSVVKALVAPIQDAVRASKKEYMVDAPQQPVAVQPQIPSKPAVYDPNDVARTTVKETNLFDAHGRGGLQIAAHKPRVYDPDAVARTTIRETTSASTDGVSSIVGGARKGVVYDPDSVARTTVKETSLAEAPLANVRQAAYKSTTYDPDAVARTTVKETSLAEAPRVNVRQAAYKSTAYDPDAVARTTIKETGLAEAPRVNVKQAAYKSTAYDPDAVARTTIKETGLAEAPRVNVKQAAYKSTAYDPDAVARTTIKETGLAEAPRVNVKQAAYKPTTYDPDAVARTTIKETGLKDTMGMGSIVGGKQKTTVYPEDEAKVTMRETLEGEIEEQRERNVAGNVAHVIRDPDQVPKKTVKETTIDNEREGNVESLEGTRGAYSTITVHAPHTQKETLHREYIGSANIGDGAGGYEVANPEAKQTQKQTLSDNDYYGTAANQGAKAPSSYEQMYNAELNETRELVLEGREPTQTGVKLSVGPDSVSLQEPKVPRLPSVANARLQDEEAVAEGAMHHANPPPGGTNAAEDPEREVSGPHLTRDRHAYENIDRLDVATMEPLLSNPYAIPSFAGGRPSAE